VRWSPSSDVSVYVGGLVGVGAVLAVPVASSSCDGRMERAAAGWYTSWRHESGAGWWRGRPLSLALPDVGADPPAPADEATESGKCRSFIPRSPCTVAGLLLSPCTSKILIPVIRYSSSLRYLSRFILLGLLLPGLHIVDKY
jgi:hypothetical protein